MRSELFRLLLVLVPGIALDAEAQTDTTVGKRDSLPVHELSEIVVHGVHTVPAPLPYTIVEVEPRAVRQLDAVAVADVARLVPAARIQTNSRGETLVYLRNAGERQVAAFLDGALLNIPWDNRVDLSLVPASMIGGVSVVQGVPPVEYGTNVLGGAVNLTSPSWTDSRSRVDVSVAGGTQNQLQGSLAARGTAGSWLYGVSLGHAARDGLPLPGDAGLAFSQPDPGLRTNTDSRITNASGRVVHQFPGGTEVGLSLFHLDAEKGVAPEGHKDPAVSNVRFWRYPDWRNTMGILSGRGTLGTRTIWKGAFWANHFNQAIDSYTSVSYDSLQAREEDYDFTVGGRLVGQRGIGSSAAKLAVNALTSTHKQRDLSLEPDGRPVGPLPAQLVYQQVLLSTGVEYEVDPINRLDLTLGASFDAMFAPKTGDKPSLDGFTDYSVTAGAGFRIDGGWLLRAGAGRKSRFPTMRELFGEALNRFLLNPDLKPESSVLTEIALGIRRTTLQVEIVPFGAFTSNTIDQRAVVVAGETRARRQRINLRGSRVLGVELTTTFLPRPDLSLAGHLTLSQVRRLQDSLPTDPIYLSEKPATLGRLAASYAPAAGPTGMVEGIYTGRAYSLDDNNQFVALPTSLVLNLRAGYRFALPGDRSLELYLRLDNATDELVVPQLGLPDAGRNTQGGIKASF